MFATIPAKITTKASMPIIKVAILIEGKDLFNMAPLNLSPVVPPNLNTT